MAGYSEYSPTMYGSVPSAPMNPLQGLAAGGSLIAPFIFGQDDPLKAMALQLLGSQGGLGIRPSLLSAMLSNTDNKNETAEGVRSEAAASLSAGAGYPTATRQRLMGYDGLSGPAQYGTFSRLGLNLGGSLS